VSTNNELHDDFFKIRSSSNPQENSNNNGENDDKRYNNSDEDVEEDIIEYGFYVDSDDDVDEDNNKKQQKKQKQQPEPENETWSLVEVAPFLVGGSNGNNEGESIFQIGVPGVVMNMMESLSSNNANNTGMNYTSSRHNVIVSPSATHWLPRKKKY
jgi:hypothetical protein